MIFKKAGEKWDTREVIAWVQHISTTQLEQDYSERFTQARIIGKVLMTLTEEDLASPPLSIENALHRKMLAAEIKTLDESRFLRPKNMWEYKVCFICMLSSSDHDFSKEVITFYSYSFC